MVKFRKFLAAGVCLLSGVLALSAKDVGTYHVGDVAGVDITTPVALDVMDPVSTALLKETEKLKTPAIFRDFSGSATNAMTKEFSTAFAATRNNFLAAVQETFRKPMLNEAEISSPEFANLITTFNGKGKFLPVPASLEAQWARGGDGSEVQNQWLGSLLQTMRSPINSGDLPGDFAIGEILRLLPVSSPDEKPALETAEQNGVLVTTSSLLTLARAQAMFCGGFSENEQPLAHALAAFIKPTCVPDPVLTQQARERDVRQFAVVNHYDAGQMVVRRGDTIDVKDKVALDQLHDKLVPVELNFQLSVERERAGRVQQQSQHDHDAAQDLQNQAANARERDQWLIGALSALSALFVITLLVFWWLNARRRRATRMLPVLSAGLQLPAGQSEIVVYLAQAVKEALLQELAAQRGELLKAQQDAAAELVGLVHRLDELQNPLQERLQAYETRIQKLETLRAAPAQITLPALSTEPEHKNGDLSPVVGREENIDRLLADGQALLNSNEPEMALKCFDDALALNPDHVETLIKKGGALERLGQFNEAIACYDRAIEADGTITIAYLHKGGLFNRLARYDEAMQCYEKALQTQGKVAA